MEKYRRAEGFVVTRRARRAVEGRTSSLGDDRQLELECRDRKEAGVKNEIRTDYGIKTRINSEDEDATRKKSADPNPRTPTRNATLPNKREQYSLRNYDADIPLLGAGAINVLLDSNALYEILNRLSYDGRRTKANNMSQRRLATPTNGVKVEISATILFATEISGNYLIK
ncbi:hypothetical protein EVAR_87664_1 [Eumeta japonica]|uniref:Uncharacterized protein n=1 Tax=Eumeta variegata TaxID=151549 RepID=A0A4C1WLS3_EUMVA|nr:hypothetical protein EVAR_87664_1 [Eumeta japonica]